MPWVYEFSCQQCQKTFEVPSCSIADRSRRFLYCSPACYNVAKLDNRRGAFITCATCKKEFYVMPSRLKQAATQGAKTRYCSMKCYKKDGDLNPFWGKQHKPEVVMRFLVNPNRRIFPPGRANPNYRRWYFDPTRSHNPARSRNTPAPSPPRAPSSHPDGRPTPIAA